MYNFKINKLKQVNFIKISNDKNPIHLIKDNLSKLNLEGTVVHGMNVVLTTLEILTKKKDINSSKIYQIKCKFLKIIYLNEILKIKFKKNKDKIIVFVLSNNLKCLELEILLSYEIFPKDNIKLIKSKYDHPKKNSPLSRKKLVKINHIFDLKNIIKIYPNLSKELNYKIISSFIMMSTSVGMFWPGKNSLFVGFDVFLKKVEKKNIDLVILKTDKRTNYSIINYKSYYCVGKLFTFFTKEKVQQPSFSYLSKKITKKNLKNHKALVIGGSRGLGELTAKIIASSGGIVTITYNKNKSLAKNLVEIFRSQKLKLKIQELKINKDGNFNHKTLKKKNYNCLYYFPTPIIFRKKSQKFSPKIYKEFYNIYCKALIKIIKILNIKNLIIFYPSTVFNCIDNKNFVEYILAKKKGAEKLKIMKKKLKFVPFIKKLPPLKTDQNNTIFSQNISYGAREISKITVEIEKILVNN